MPADFQRVKEIFLAAVEKAGSEDRDAFLWKACGADEALRQQVEVLLHRHQQAGNFLEAPAQPLPATVLPEEAEAGRASPLALAGRMAGGEGMAEEVGSHIGPYKLLQRLGEGGMGAVWVAEQTEPVKRRVAVKVIKPGMDSAQVIRRFEAERQALALMDHANIAKVLDAGTTEAGRPYFVMELVKGVPITKYCDREHLTPKERLQLFIPVCQAVQHAHQKGIIHRDLKPSNVLIGLYDGQAIPKVIDFGVAKATAQKLTEQTIFTEVGQIVGTLEYMAPEQAELTNLDIDTRADIYSLGVILYELLAGSPPFTRKQLRSAAFSEMLRMIREEEPPRPSTRLSSSDELPSIAANRHLEPKKLTKLVHGELDWIAMKCLAKERSRRYETANGLVMDIQRYLADEPVLAGPPSARYRLRKFAGKYRKALITASAFAVLLIAGAVVSAWQWLRAEHEASVAGQERNEAETSFRQALEAVDRFCTEVSQDVLLHEPGMQPLRRKLLASGRDYYLSFVARRSGDTRARVELGRAQLRLAGLAADLDTKAEALRLYEEALAYFEDLDRQFPGVAEYRHALAVGYGEFADWRLGKQQPRDAERLYRKALAIAEGLAAADSPAVRVTEALARFQRGLGSALTDLRDFPAAEAALQDALRRRQQLRTDHPAKNEYLEDEANTQHALGRLYHVQGRMDRAETAWQAVQEIYARLHDQQPNRPAYLAALGGSYHSLGSLYLDTRDLTQAEASFKKAVEIQKTLAAANPQVTRYQADLARRFQSLGEVFRCANLWTESEAALKQALTIQQQLVRDYADEPGFRNALGRTYGGVSMLKTDSRKPKEAQESLREALACHESVVRADPDSAEFQHDLANTHNLFGTFWRNQNDQQAAEKEFRQARDIWDRLNRAHPGVFECQNRLVWANYNLALVYKDTDRLEQAEQAFRDTLQALTELARSYPNVKSIPVVRGRTLSNLGHVLRDAEKSEEALPWYAQAEKQLSSMRQADPRDAQTRDALRNVYWGRAQALGKLGRHAEALKDWDRALELEAGAYRSKVRLLRGVTVAQLGDHAAALALLNELAKEPSPNGDLDFTRARICAAAATALRQDARSSLTERKTQAATLEARALELLHLTQAAGYFDSAFKINEVRTDPVFAPLRMQPDFRVLIRGLEEKSGQGKGR